MNEDNIESVTIDLYNSIKELRTKGSFKDLLHSNLEIYYNSVSGDGIVNDDLLYGKVVDNTLDYVQSLNGKKRR